ncbi:MAG: hypothetical protein AAF732_18415 [Pseudomonadota bacterium]
MDTRHGRLPAPFAVLARDIDDVGLQARLEIVRAHPKDPGAGANGMMININGMPF